MANTKVALVTGASRGIGRTVALGLAEDGYHLGVIARSDLSELCAEARKLGVRARPFQVSVDNQEAVEQAVAKLVEAEGRIDLLFNNAGVYKKGDVNLSSQEFQQILNVNLTGAFNVLRAVVPVMKRQGRGTIINIASISGTIGFANTGAYCASKFGLLGLNESLFNELVPQGINVTAICPSWVDTQMAAHAPIPGQQMIQREDILETVRYLSRISPSASIKEIVIDCRNALS